MTQYKEIIVFPPQGKMDSDSDVRVIKKGDIIDAMNCRWGLKNESVNTVENVKGNILINIGLPEGNNKVIGGCCDYPNNSVVIFLYNSYNRHSILYLNMVTKTIQPLLWDEQTLNFDDIYIVNAHVLDGIVYWLDNNGLRNLIIEMAIKYTNTKYNNGIGFWLVEEYIVQPD